MLELAAVVIGAIITSIIGGIVFIRGVDNLTNRFFVILSGALVGWSVTTYFSLNTTSDDETLFWIRAIMFFVILQNTAFFYLVQVFPNFSKKKFWDTKKRVGVTFSIIAGVVAVSPWLFTDFVDGAPVPGPGMAFFLPHALVFAIGGIVTLIRKFRRSSGLERTQLMYFLLATILMFTLVPINNFVVPLIFKSGDLVNLSPLFPIIFASLFGYAILSSRLFDIRLIIARTIGYVSTLAIVGMVYTVVIFFVTSRIFGASISIDAEFVSFTFAALALAVSFSYLRQLIDRYTRRLFFRDSYRTQDVLNKLSSLLATEIDLITIVRDSASLLSETLKPTHIRLVVFDSSNKTFYDYGSASAPSNSVNYEAIQQLENQVVFRDRIDLKQRASLEKYDADIVLKLETNDELVGVVMLGPKQTGSPYNDQDLGMMRIIEQELSIAVQNARYFEEIQKFNVTLQRKIKQATNRLEQSNEKLKQLDEAKDEFISMASHQLRTPLTSIKGYVSMVIEGDAGKINKQQKTLLEEAFGSSQRMVYLIADLLNVSRLRTGKFVIEKNEANLAEMVRSEIEQLKPTARSRKLKLNYTMPKRFPTVMLDETKTRQVIMNFTDNAIYYTPSGGTIDVSVKAVKGAIEFRVKDDGIGIARDKQNKLFSKFFRADNAKKARPDGTGLGLYMAKKVILAQGGTIIFESEEGKGSTFGFRLKR